MENIEQHIKERLVEIEQTKGVRILYACESGSRAWGFPSADSDYDVRFIYLHPIEHYLSIQDRRDVIECPIENDVDMSGWDLRKTLKLFRKFNPPLLEWLGSPIVYMEKSPLAQELRALLAKHYSPSACAYHYLHMAQRNYRTYLKGDIVWIKKYLYVLRPLFAIIWLERNLGVVPTEFTVMIDRLDLNSTLNKEIARLIDEKKAGAELDKGPRIPAISDFIDEELARLENMVFDFAKDYPDVNVLDELFRMMLEEVWSR
jgi:uncharacterized protein